MIKVINFKYNVSDEDLVVNTTSSSTNWSRALSPFLLGPVDLYDGYVSQTIENAWQYAKVHGSFTDDGQPNQAYFEWAQKGWNSKWANRYPMGRNAKPLYSYWDSEKLDYVNARLKIYIPLYSRLVKQTSAFSKLKEIYENKNSILYLQDYDAHNLNPPIDYWKFWKNPDVKMGHAYVLAMMLEGIL